MRVVIRLGSLPPWVVLSGLLHVSVVVVAMLIGSLTSKAQTFEPSLSVELVGALPGGAPSVSLPAAVAPQPQPEPEPEPEEVPVIPPPLPEPEPEEPDVDTDVKFDPTPDEPEEEEPEEEEPPLPRPQPTPPADPPEDAPKEYVQGETAQQLGQTGVGSVEGIGDRFNWYKVQLVAALRRAWRQPYIAGLQQPLEVPVTFVLLRDGRVVEPRLLGSSGQWSVDDSVRRAMLEARLPPMPPALEGDMKTIRTVFVMFPQEGR